MLISLLLTVGCSKKESGPGVGIAELSTPSTELPPFLGKQISPPSAENLTGSLSGVAFKGPIQGVRILFVPNIPNQTYYDTGINTDADGKFRIPISPPFEPTPALIFTDFRNGSYVDEATGTLISPTNQSFSTPLIIQPGQTTIENIAITPLTTLATRYAQLLVAHGNISWNDAIKRGIEQIASHFGLGGIDITRTIPADLTDDIPDPISAPETRYGLILAALSQLAKNRDTSLRDLLYALENDLGDKSQPSSSTLLFDGKSFGYYNYFPYSYFLQDVPLKVYPERELLGSDATTLQLGTALKDFIENPRNKSGLKMEDIFNLVEELITFSITGYAVGIPRAKISIEKQDRGENYTYWASTQADENGFFHKTIPLNTKEEEEDGYRIILTARHLESISEFTDLRLLMGIIPTGFIGDKRVAITPLTNMEGSGFESPRIWSIVSHFGLTYHSSQFDGVHTIPTNLRDTIPDNPNSDETRYALVLEAFSRLASQYIDDNNPYQAPKEILLSACLAKDVEEDRQFNNNPVCGSFLKKPILPETTTKELSKALVDFVTSQDNQSGITISQLSELISELSSYRVHSQEYPSSSSTKLLEAYADIHPPHNSVFKKGEQIIFGPNQTENNLIVCTSRPSSYLDPTKDPQILGCSGQYNEPFQPIYHDIPAIIDPTDNKRYRFYYKFYTLSWSKPSRVFMVEYEVDNFPPDATHKIVPPSGTVTKELSLDLSFPQAPPDADVYVKLPGSTQYQNFGKALQAMVKLNLPDATSYTLNYLFKDEADNESESQTATYSVDRSAPKAEIVPPSGTVTKEVSLPLSFTNVTEDPDGVEVFAKLPGASDYQSFGNVKTAQIPLVFSSENSPHKVQFYFKDEVGNSSTPAEAYYFYDKTPPVVTISAPEEGCYKTDQKITLLSSEPVTYLYTWDGSDPITSPTPEKFVEAFKEADQPLVINFSDPRQTFRYAAKDLVGNLTSSSLPKIFLIEKEPFVRLTSIMPSDRNRFESGEAVTFTFERTLNGIEILGGYNGTLTLPVSLDLLKQPVAYQIPPDAIGTFNFAYKAHPFSDKPSCQSDIISTDIQFIPKATISAQKTEFPYDTLIHYIPNLSFSISAPIGIQNIYYTTELDPTTLQTIPFNSNQRFSFSIKDFPFPAPAREMNLGVLLSNNRLMEKKFKLVDGVRKIKKIVGETSLFQSYEKILSGLDGTLYLLGGGAIETISPNKELSMLIANGVSLLGPNTPRLTPFDIALGPDGVLYIADNVKPASIWKLSWLPELRIEKLFSLETVGDFDHQTYGGQFRSIAISSTGVIYATTFIPKPPIGYSPGIYTFFKDQEKGSWTMQRISRDRADKIFSLSDGSLLAYFKDAIAVPNNFYASVKKYSLSPTGQFMSEPFIAISGNTWIPAGANLLEISDIAVGPDDSVYIADHRAHLIKRISSDGQIEIISGGGNNEGNPSPALEASMNPRLITTNLGGHVFFWDDFRQTIRAIILESSTERTVRTYYGRDIRDRHSPNMWPIYVPDLSSFGRISHVALSPEGEKYLFDSQLFYDEKGKILPQLRFITNQRPPSLGTHEDLGHFIQTPTNLSQSYGFSAPFIVHNQNDIVFAATELLPLYPGGPPGNYFFSLKRYTKDAGGNVTVEVLAGSPNGSMGENILASEAKLTQIKHLVFDNESYYFDYVFDDLLGRHHLIKKMSRDYQGLWRIVTVSSPTMIFQTSDAIGNLFIGEQFSFSIQRVDGETGVTTTVIDQSSFPQRLYPAQLLIWNSSLFINTENALYEWYLDAPSPSP